MRTAGGRAAQPWAQRRDGGPPKDPQSDPSALSPLKEPRIGPLRLGEAAGGSRAGLGARSAVWGLTRGPGSLWPSPRAGR